MQRYNFFTKAYTIQIIFPSTTIIIKTILQPIFINDQGGPERIRPDDLYYEIL